jgi:hypothetical protein
VRRRRRLCILYQEEEIKSKLSLYNFVFKLLKLPHCPVKFYRKILVKTKICHCKVIRKTIRVGYGRDAMLHKPLSIKLHLIHNLIDHIVTVYCYLITIEPIMEINFQ